MALREYSTSISAGAVPCELSVNKSHNQLWKTFNLQLVSGRFHLSVHRSTFLPSCHHLSVPTILSSCKQLTLCQLVLFCVLCAGLELIRCQGRQRQQERFCFLLLVKSSPPLLGMARGNRQRWRRYHSTHSNNYKYRKRDVNPSNCPKILSLMLRKGNGFARLFPKVVPHVKWSYTVIMACQAVIKKSTKTGDTHWLIPCKALRNSIEGRRWKELIYLMRGE